MNVCWFDRFKLWNGIVCCRVCGESGVIDIDIKYDGKNYKFLKLIKGYKCICILCDIFNVDEICLFYKLMFEKCYNLKVKNIKLVKDWKIG